MAGIFTKTGLLTRLLQKIAGESKDSPDTTDEVSFSVLTKDVMTEVDVATPRKAIAFYKKYMLKIGYLEKGELGDFVTSLTEEIKSHEQEIKDALSWAKDTLSDAKAEFKATKKQFAKCKNQEDKDHLSYEMASVEEDVASATSDFKKISSELKQFKSDKAPFLIRYINSEVHGPGWDKRKAS